MCTVLLRFTPGGRWPLLLAAVRDEFADRPWDPPARHWDGPAAGLVGGRDRVAGGTWLALAPAVPALAPVPAVAVAAVLNGVPLAAPVGGDRPSRGGLPLAALTTGELSELSGYDGFHLVRGEPGRVEVWSWDGTAVRRQELAPGDHIVVNAGVDPAGDPRTDHFLPLLRRAADPDPRPGLPPELAWGGWLRLLAGDGLDPADGRALVVRQHRLGLVYGSTSACLLALSPGAVRYDFTAAPGPAAVWYEVDLGRSGERG